MGAVTILIIMLILVTLLVGGYFAYQKLFSKSSGQDDKKSTDSRKYSIVYSTTAGKKKGSFEKGACTNPSADGTKGPASTKSTDCAAACDAVKAPAVCNGYDWDGSNGCTLYATLPTTAKYDSTKKDECRALSSAK